MSDELSSGERREREKERAFGGSIFPRNMSYRKRSQLELLRVSQPSNGYCDETMLVGLLDLPFKILIFSGEKHRKTRIEDLFHFNI